MADLGQDRDSLHLKQMEIEHSIQQKKLARNSIELDKARMTVKTKQYAQSLKDLDKAIAEHEADLAGICQTIEQMKD